MKKPISAPALIFGIHAVEARLLQTPETISVLYVLESARIDSRLGALLKAAEAKNLSIQRLKRSQLDEMLQNDARHQGIIAQCQSDQPLAAADFKALLKNIPENCLLLVLDGVQDPHNLGACLRTADAAGVHGVIIPKDQAVGVTSTVRKVACGAVESVPLYTVTNIARAIEDLKKQGVWVYGLAGEAKESFHLMSGTGPIAVVLGSEGNGLRRLTRERCDGLYKIPMSGTVGSLNVSVATGVCLFEVVRQRRCSNSRRP